MLVVSERSRGELAGREVERGHCSLRLFGEVFLTDEPLALIPWAAMPVGRGCLGGRRMSYVVCCGRGERLRWIADLCHRCPVKTLWSTWLQARAYSSFVVYGPGVNPANTMNTVKHMQPCLPQHLECRWQEIVVWVYASHASDVL